MPTYKKETEQRHMERIREILALKPNAGRRAIKEALEGDSSAPLNLDEDYITKLKKKIEGERAHRFDEAKVGKRLAELQDRSETVIAQMWRILLDNTADERARVGAGKIILDAEHKLFDAQLSSGIFERKLGTVDIRHTYELTPEMTALKAVILSVFTSHGIIKPADTTRAGLPDRGASPALIEQPRNAA